MIRRALQALATPFLVLSLVGASFGQQGEEPVDDSMLRGRDREAMHPGDPFEIVGLEQGDNSFRHRTPALMRADTTPTLVDPNELYERRMAMYEDGRKFTKPAGPARGSYSESREPAQAITKTAVVDKKGGASVLMWVLLAAFAGLMGAWIHQRRGFFRGNAI